MGWEVKTVVGGQAKWSLRRFQYDYIKIFTQGSPRANFLHFLRPKKLFAGWCKSIGVFFFSKMVKYDSVGTKWHKLSDYECLGGIVK